MPFLEDGKTFRISSDEDLIEVGRFMDIHEEIIQEILSEEPTELLPIDLIYIPDDPCCEFGW